MESNAWLFQILSALVYATVGVRLLRMALRGRELPEGLLGSYFVLTGISYAAYQLPVILVVDTWYTPLAFAGRVIYDAGMLPFLLFLRLVFHRGDRWAGWLAAASGLLLAAGLLGGAAGGDYEGVSLDSTWFWLEWTGYTLPFAWLAWAAFSEHRQALRRVRIGLTRPLLANRYLLWAIFGAVQVAASVALIPMYADYARHGVYSAWSDALLGGLENLSLGMLWLVFFTPALYRRWIEGDPSARAEAH